MMHLNNAAPAEQAPKKPCMRDMHELVTNHMPDQLIKLVPLDELRRFGNELVAEQPRFAEEVPLRLAGEARRRARFRGLQVAGQLVPVLSTAQSTYSHA